MRPLRQEGNLPLLTPRHFPEILLKLVKIYEINTFQGLSLKPGLYLTLPAHSHEKSELTRVRSGWSGLREGAELVRKRDAHLMAL